MKSTVTESIIANRSLFFFFFFLPVSSGVTKNKESFRICSLANGDPLFYRAILTLHVATPVKFASAHLDASLSDHVVPSAAAKAAASVATGTGLVAPTTSGAGNVRARIPFAEIGRFLVIEQLFSEIPRPSLSSATAMFPLPLSIRPSSSRTPHSCQRRYAAEIALCH